MPSVSFFDLLFWDDRNDRIVFVIFVMRFPDMSKFSKLTLLGACVVVGVRYAVKYGWLCGYTHWQVERSRMNREDLLERLRERGY